MRSTSRCTLGTAALDRRPGVLGDGGDGAALAAEAGLLAPSSRLTAVGARSRVSGSTSSRSPRTPKSWPADTCGWRVRAAVYEPVRQRVPRGTQRPTVSAARHAPSHPPAPQCRRALSTFASHVPCRRCRPDSRRLHAGHHLANRRAPARLIPAPINRPGFDVSSLFRHVINGSLTLAFPIPPYAITPRLFLNAHHDGLQPTQLEVV